MQTGPASTRSEGQPEHDPNDNMLEAQPLKRKHERSPVARSWPDQHKLKPDHAELGRATSVGSPIWSFLNLLGLLNWPTEKGGIKVSRCPLYTRPDAPIESLHQGNHDSAATIAPPLNCSNYDYLNFGSYKISKKLRGPSYRLET